MRDVAYSAGLRNDIAREGGHVRHMEDPRLGPLLHFVARHTVLNKLRTHWLEEGLLVVRLSGETNPRQEPRLEPALLPDRDPDPPIFRESLCAWRCGGCFKGAPSRRHAKRVHETTHCPGEQEFSYSEYVTSVLTRAEKATSEKTGWIWCLH